MTSQVLLLLCLTPQPQMSTNKTTFQPNIPHKLCCYRQEDTHQVFVTHIEDPKWTFSFVATIDGLGCSPDLLQILLVPGIIALAGLLSVIVLNGRSVGADIRTQRKWWARERGRGRASEKPNQQLLLIMDWTLIQWENKHSDDVSGFYFNKNLWKIRNPNEKCHPQRLDFTLHYEAVQ